MFGEISSVNRSEKRISRIFGGNLATSTSLDSEHTNLPHAIGATE